jgi:glycosyltransferase involved in cell wall biosynthesis
MKSNKLNHICIISPSLKMGGIERALVVLGNHFAKRGFRITFVSCLNGQQFYSLNENIQLIEPDFEHKGGLISGLTFYPRLSLFIRQQVNKASPDVVLAFGDWFSPLVLLALYGTKYPVYISDRTSPDYKFKFPIPFLKKWLYPKSAGFIAQTERAADYKRKQFGAKLNIKLIPNALREVKLYPDIQREKIILYVGRFAWEKGPERLIQAFAKILDKDEWELHMAGSGPLLEPMKLLTKDLGIDASVKFLGKVEDVDSLFAHSSIFVLPSVLEGFPNALCEAMAAGLPVVCFDSIPFDDIIIPGEDGIVIQNSKIGELAHQLDKLMHCDSEQKRLGRNAIKIKDKLSVAKVGEEILSFINPTS